jgi:hypothetical protein
MEASLRLRYREDTHLLLVFPGPDEAHRAVYSGEKRMIAAQSDIGTGKEHGAVLTHDDIARLDYLASKFLHSQSLRIAVAAVPRAATSFLMCQRISPPAKQFQSRNNLL